MKRLIFSAILATLITTSCSEDAKYDNLLIEDPVEYTDEEKNDLICSYAQILATAIEDNEVKNIIKNEAQQQFDGDYDILTSKLQDKTLSNNGMTLQHRMAETNVLTRSSEKGFKGDLMELLKEIQTVVPNLQVSVPVHCDDWDTENYTPLVAFKPGYYTDSYPETIKAFDSEGNVHILSRTEEPEFPVIVVSESERIKPDGTSIFDDECSEESIKNLLLTKATLSTPTGLFLKHSTAGSFDLYWDAIVSDGYYQIDRRENGASAFTTIGNVDGDENFYKSSGLTPGQKYDYRIRLINGNDQSAYTSVVTSTASERSVNDPLKLVWYKIDPDFMKKIESWDSGRPELRITVFYGVNYSGDTGQYESHILSPTRNNLKDGCDPNFTIFNQWDPYNRGKALKVFWMEEDRDDGDTRTVNVSLNYENQQNNGNLAFATQITYTTTHQYYDLGTDEVCWWDSYATIYNEIGLGNSIFEFKFGK